MFRCVFSELYYGIDVCRVTKASETGHVQHIRTILKTCTKERYKYYLGYTSNTSFSIELRKCVSIAFIVAIYIYRVLLYSSIT
jgi:hypothetical protein